jgi:hypothetical protein
MQLLGRRSRRNPENAVWIAAHSLNLTECCGRALGVKAAKPQRVARRGRGPYEPLLLPGTRRGVRREDRQRDLKRHCKKGPSKSTRRPLAALRSDDVKYLLDTLWAHSAPSADRHPLCKERPRCIAPAARAVNVARRDSPWTWLSEILPWSRPTLARSSAHGPPRRPTQRSPTSSLPMSIEKCRSMTAESCRGIWAARARGLTGPRLVGGSVCGGLDARGLVSSSVRGG